MTNQTSTGVSQAFVRPMAPWRGMLRPIAALFPTPLVPAVESIHRSSRKIFGNDWSICIICFQMRSKMLQEAWGRFGLNFAFYFGVIAWISIWPSGKPKGSSMIFLGQCCMKLSRFMQSDGWTQPPCGWTRLLKRALVVFALGHRSHSRGQLWKGNMTFQQGAVGVCAVQSSWTNRTTFCVSLISSTEQIESKRQRVAHQRDHHP